MGSDCLLVKDILNCLEKWKEKKSLSTEETELNSIAFLEQMGYTCIPPGKEHPTEWSEEDEQTINTIINHFKVDLECTDEDDIIVWLEELQYRLKSLRPQPHWKPSDEQLRPLEYAIDYFKKKKNDTTYLESLYEELKKL